MITKFRRGILESIVDSSKPSRGALPLIDTYLEQCLKLGFRYANNYLSDSETSLSRRIDNRMSLPSDISSRLLFHRWANFVNERRFTEVSSVALYFTCCDELSVEASTIRLAWMTCENSFLSNDEPTSRKSKSFRCTFSIRFLLSISVLSSISISLAQ